MSLREDFEQILRDYGHNILLVRQSSPLRCSCWREKEQEASSDCPSCFGLGTVPTIEKHTVREMVANIPISLPMLKNRGEFGDMTVSGMAFYFSPSANVQIGDLVVQVDWSSTGKPIFTGPIYEVNYVDSKRFDRGEIVYKKAYTKTEPVQRNIRGIRIVNTNGIKNYELLENKEG